MKICFNELALKRESCRSYTDKKVEREKLENMLECARNAPSACNSQPWKFVIIDNVDIANKLSQTITDEKVSFNKFAQKCSAFFVVCEQKALLSSGNYDQKYAPMDIGMAVENICLSAAAQDLSTCIMGYFHEDDIKNLLSIPDEIKIRLVIAVGYPNTIEPRKKVRKELHEISSFNAW